MKTIKTSIQNEINKLLARRKIKLTMILILTIVLCASIFLKLMLPAMIIEPIGVLKLLSGFVLPLFVGFISIDLFVSEKSDDTLKNTMMLPITNTELFASKLIAGILVSSVLMGLIWLETTIISVVFNGFGVTAEGFVTSILVYLFLLLPITLIAVLSSLIGQMFNSTGSAIVVSIVLVIGLNALGIFFAPIRQLNPLTYLDAYEGVLFGVHKGTNLLTLLLYMGSYYIIGGTLSLLRMNRYTEQTR